MSVELEPGTLVQVHNPAPGITGVVVAGDPYVGWGGHRYVRVRWDEDDRMSFARVDLLREVVLTPPSDASDDVLGDGSCWCGDRGICSACPPCKTPAAPTPALSEFAAYVQHSVIDGGSIMPPPCKTCDGAGTVEEACGRDQFGVWETDTWPCPDCKGTGD